MPGLGASGGPAMTKLGVFVVPDAARPGARRSAQIVAADRAGLDLVGVQDHPYQRRFFDTWTLLAYVAARTERITLLPDVINLPLRQPAVLAKAAASLDLLSGGRVELGLGAGAFWEGVEAMGGPRRTPGESVEALEEAMQIMRVLPRHGAVRPLRGEALPRRRRQARPSAGAPDRALGGRLRPADAAADGAARRRLAAVGRRQLPLRGGRAAARRRLIDEAARRAGRDPGDDRPRRERRAGRRRASGSTPSASPSSRARLRFDALLVSTPDDDPLAFIEALGETAAALRA